MLSYATESSPVDRSDVHASGAQGGVEMAWKDDVALEMWIDVKPAAVTIKLEGALDEATGANLMGVVDSCLDEGVADFELDTRGLRIGHDGTAVMLRIRQRIVGAGGHMHWDRAAVA